MNSRVRNVLLFVVLFVIASGALFAQTRVFLPSDISTTLDNPGPNGPNHAIITSVVKVVVTDPDHGTSYAIETATVDFTQFGGPVAVDMVQDPGLGIWRASYTVMPGTLSGASARVRVTAEAFNGDGQMTQDDVYFDVDNVPAVLGDLGIVASILNPGPTGVAIVGSTINLTFDSANISAANADFTSFGGTIVPMTQVGTVFSASYTVVAGTSEFTGPVTVYAWELANPNPGIANSNSISIDNILPSVANFHAGDSYLSVIDTRTAPTLLKLGQSIQVIAKFDLKIKKAWINWGLTFASGGIEEYDVVNGNLVNAIFKPLDGDLVYAADLEVYITKLETNSGNVSDVSLVIPVSKNADGLPIIAVLSAPSFHVNDMDLYFDNTFDVNGYPNGWLRFSPDSPAVAGFDDAPNHVNMYLHLENWGQTGDLYGLQLRFEAERSVFYRDYEYPDADAAYNSTTKELVISWDGKDASGNFVANNTYGVTLWKVWDQVGNALELQPYYKIGAEYPPHFPLLDGDGNPQVRLNRMHVVVDNVPMEFASPLAADGPVEFILARHTDHFVGDVVFPDQIVETWNGATNTGLSFQAKRSFLVDTNPLRHEWGWQWNILTEYDDTDTPIADWYWDFATSAWLPMALFDFNTMATDLVFATDTALNASVVDFSFNALDFQPAYTIVQGDYERNFKLVTYLKDNAGNISGSTPMPIKVKHEVTETTHTANLALVTDIEIISVHDGGLHSLPPYDAASNHNFYLKAEPYYPLSLDEIDIQVTLNNKNYLKDGGALVMDLSALGLGQITKTKADFNDLNQVVITISNAMINSLAASYADLWTVGPNGVKNIPVTAISSVVMPADLLEHDYPTVSTHSDLFNLVVPPAPVYPTPGTVSLDRDAISPGHAAWTYNAEINHAHDLAFDNTDITIEVPASTFDMTWLLRAINTAGEVWSKTGDLLAGNALPPTIFTFDGLTNNLQPLVEKSSVGEIDIELKVMAMQYADDGYLEVEDQITAATLLIDNENPYILAHDGYSYDHNTRKVEFDATPVISNLSNEFEIVLKTNEPLRTGNLNAPYISYNYANPVPWETWSKDPGWSATILDAAGNPLVIDGNNISASVVYAEDLTENVYKLRISVSGIATVSELLDAVVILRLPWDVAGNPGRINSPSYPMGADVFWQDSSEVNFGINILNDRPWISKLEFIHHQSTGSVEYDEAGNASNFVQGYVGNAHDTATLKAWIAALNVRTITPKYIPDLSALPGASILNRTDTVDGAYKLITWEIDMSAVNSVDTMDPYLIEVKIESTEDASTSPVYYSTGRSINLLGDDDIPSYANFTWDADATNTVTAGQNNAFAFSISDIPSGIWWDAASIEVSFSSPEVTLVGALTYADPVVSGVMSVSSDVPHFVMSYKVTDNVGNEATVSKYINVIPSPVPSALVITGNPAAPAFFRPGFDDIETSWQVSDSQRAEDLTVKLWDRTASPNVEVASVTLANDVVSHTFVGIDVDHTHELELEVIVNYLAYADQDASTLTAYTNSELSGNKVMADGVDPHGLPIIDVVTTYPEVLIINGVNTLTYDVSDLHSGVDYASYNLDILVDGVAYSTGITVSDSYVPGAVSFDLDLDASITTSRIEARFQIMDKVGNQDEVIRFLNVEALPVVSNLHIEDLSTDNIDPTNWYVPGHPLQVSFDIDGHLRTEFLKITLDADGTEIDSYTFAAAEFAASMEHTFTGLTEAMDLDGKVITATISGYVMYYNDPITDGDLQEPILFSPAGVDNISINVDTKPVIGISFHVGGDLDNEINYLLPNLAQMNNVQVKATVVYPNDLDKLYEPVIELDPSFGSITLSALVNSYTDANGDKIFVYNVLNLNMVYDATTLLAEATFTANIKTVYGYEAVEKEHSMLILGTPTLDQYGLKVPTRGFDDVGRAPNGWFAPEHDLITEYFFVSIMDPANVEVEGEFDRITDNVPEVWFAPNTLTHTSTVYTLTDGRTITVYSYLAIWEVEPDYASVWNAYVDGEAVQVDYRFNVAPLSPYVDFSMVQVDKEVPEYELSYYEIAVAKGTDLPVYETISTLPSADHYRSINLALDPPAPGVWPADQHVYLKLQMNDGPGVGAGWVTKPVADGWDVEQIASVTVGNTLYVEWKLSPTGIINDASQLVIQLQDVEDLTGHKNYAGTDNTPIHSHKYVPVAPVINIGFNAGSDNGLIANVIAYQKLADPLDTYTSPYIMPGQNLGFQLELELTRSAEVDEIEPILVQINDPSQVNDDNEIWHDLAMIDAADPYKWYLASDIPILATDDLSVNSLGLKYKITYEVRYEDGTIENKYFTSSWFDLDLANNQLILIDRTAPQFVVDGVVIRSASSVTDNYVVPTEEITITVRFTDEYLYNDVDTKPSVTISNLHTFIDGVGAVYNVNNDDISHDGSQWIAQVSGLIATNNPGIISQVIDIALGDPVGHSAYANKFVEIANNGPIVPLIRDAKYFTQIEGGAWVETAVEALAGQSVNAKIEVYVDVQHREYIDAAWITIPGGENITIPTSYTIREAEVGEAGRWVVVFENVVAQDLVAGEINFVAHTKRIPYSAEIFEHNFAFSVNVDLMDFVADTPIVRGRAINDTWIDDIISPERRARIRVDISDIGEDFASLLPADISDWVSLTVDPAALFTNIPTPTVTGSHSFVWNILASDIEDLGIETASIKIVYKNIYGQVLEIERSFNIDNEVPQLTKLEMLMDDTLVTDNTGGSLFWHADWNKIRVHFEEMPTVFAGLYDVDVDFVADPLTYQYDPSVYPQAYAALTSMQYSALNVNADGTGYVDITFSAPYSGTTLPNGRYWVKINNLTDMFGASVDIAPQAFDYQYEPAAMTIYINGVVNNSSLNVSESPIGIIANTSSDVSGLVGVEFRLYYDVDNSGDLSEADLAHELTHHLSTPTDLVFPYDTYWNMTGDVYKFVDEAAYTGVPYRGFILRVSAITQSRDLYNYDHYIQVMDDIAPDALPNMANIVQVFDYETPANNTLNVDVDFIDIDVVEVSLAIFEYEQRAEVANSPITVAVLDPSINTSIPWDFEAIGLGEYTTVLTVKDFSGNTKVVDGPTISILNASSTALASVKLFNRIDISNEVEIFDQDIYNYNPIDDYLIVEATITNPASPANPLNGIAQVGFRAEIWDTTTGLMVTEYDPLMNDANLQNHNFTGGYIPAALIYVNPANQAVVRLAVDNADLAPYLLPDTDYVFRFRAEFVPVSTATGISLPEANRPYTSFRVDQLAPNVVLENVSATDPVSWADGHKASFKAEGVNPLYDVKDEVQTVRLQWFDATAGVWRAADIDNSSYKDGVWMREGWNIDGGAINCFLGENFEGTVDLRARLVDAQGNEGFSNTLTVNVDNKGPETRFTHVLHSVDYPVLTDISGETEISIVNSNVNGSSPLRLYVDAASIAADAILPVIVYHQTPDGVWQPAIFDHEANNPAYPGLYEFEIPISMLTRGDHHFAVVMADIHGNLEGDTASTTRSYNHWLEDDEKVLATDLTVHVISTDNVIAQITYPADYAYIAGAQALTADTTDNALVEYIEFQHKVNGVWNSLAEVQKADQHNLAFELKRSDLPQYDYLPWVPGVHLLNAGVEMDEMLWDAASRSWKLALDLDAGVNYVFQYGIDLNNNGTFELGEPIVSAPNGLAAFTPGLWTLALDTTVYAQGIHQFRAIPKDINGDVLEFYESPETQVIIDNVKPLVNGISSVGNIHKVVPGTTVDFVSDIEGLLVYLDDQVTVEYQFTGQPTSANYRKWYTFANANAVETNYLVNWNAPNPLTDQIDNNDDGLVDEAAEADAWYYIRAIAHDKAGNYTMSGEFAVYVDGSPAAMQLVQIEDTVLENSNFIYEIDPSLTSIQLKAIDARTPAEIAAGFDVAARAEFFYAYTNSMAAPFSAYTLIGENEVIGGEAVIAFDFITEGYYRFKVVSYDALGNDTETITTVIFDDVSGPGISFVAVGARNVVNGEFAFAADTNLFAGNLQAQLEAIAGVSSVTFEYSADDLNWYNITTTTAIPADGLVSVAWEYPNLRAPMLYLRAIAQDNGGNNMATKIVKLYHDTIAPGADVVSFTYTDIDGMKVIDQAQDLDITLSYTDLNNDGLLDVNIVRIRLKDEQDNIVLSLNKSYAEVGMAATDFLFTEAQLATLTDGIYHLELVLRDFAGNQAIIQPADYQVLYIDTTAPAALSLVSTNFPAGIAPYDSTVEFLINYTDLIGLGAADAMKAVFSYDNIEQEVDSYTLVTDPVSGQTGIEFAWIPSADFAQLFAAGALDINVAINATVTDLLGNEGQVAGNFELRYGIPANTRIMVVTDYLFDNGYEPRHNIVDWTLATPQVVEYLGTKQDAPMPLDLFAYVPHQSEIPGSVEFMWYNADSAVQDWVSIADVAVGNQWNFVHQQFNAAYIREYTASWDISGMPTGDYQVKTVSHHAAGDSESIITLHIYNGTIVPEIAINGMTDIDVERGETYTLSVENFAPNADLVQGVRYQYRYVDASNTPVSSWMYFGEANGDYIDGFVPADYSFDWVVYPYYLYNNRVQIIATAMDQWGTETPLASALAGNMYANIVNTVAPSIYDLAVDWKAVSVADGVNHEFEVSANIRTGIIPEDLESVEFFHNLDGAGEVSFDFQDGFTAAQMANDLYIVSAPYNFPSNAVNVTGYIRIETTDVFGHQNETVINLADLPLANLLVSLDGEVLDNELERGSTVVLAADLFNNLALNAVEYHVPEIVNGNPVIITITENDAPYSTEWLVHEELVFGDSYDIQTVVLDDQGNSFALTRSFVITDHTTNIVIDSVAGIAPTSIGIIDRRLHGDIPVQITVNDPAIPRVEFMLKAIDALTWDSVAFMDVTANTLTYVFDELGALDSGDYQIGVRAAAARSGYPVIADLVNITIDNDIDIAITGYSPETDGFFNGNDFIVHFTVENDDEINEGAVLLQHNTDIEPIWLGGVAATLATDDGIHYTATFANVSVPVDGFYNFRVAFEDTAYPTPNTMQIDVAANVLVDTGLPIVAMVSINGETDLTLPLDIQLTNGNVNIVASAYDIIGGQIHQIASGIEKVEFYVDGTVLHEVVVDSRSRGLYSFDWNISGYEVNTTHSIQVVAYDKAGNSDQTINYVVNIVAPQALEAYAIITAMDFDNTTSNSDVIYAVVKDWPAAGAALDLTFEYFNGTVWSFFASATNHGTYYSANFNAELMTDANALRGVINGNYNAPLPELAVSYVAGTLEPVSPQISSDIFYLNELRVVEEFAGLPIITALQGGAPQMGEPYPMNGNQVFDININAQGTHTFWAAILDDSGNIQLGKTVVETVNNGVTSDNGISFNVPVGGFGYFQQVSPQYAVPEGFNAISDQHAFFAHDNAGILVPRDLTIAIATPADEGTLVAMYYDPALGGWSAPLPVINNNDGTVSVAGVPSGVVVNVMQHTGVGIHVILDSISPVHNAGTQRWTLDNPEIKFFIYEDLDADGYVIPATVDLITLYLDNVPVAPTSAFNATTGIVGYNATNLEAGMHTMRLVALQSGFSASYEIEFYVDITEPVITAQGSQITNANRTVMAQILDPETGIKDVRLVLNGMLDITMDRMTIAGDSYTYEISDEDLFVLGYNFSDTMDLYADWFADNNLDLTNSLIDVVYTVNIQGPGIVFTGFENGWWINPTNNTPLTFNVIVPAGRELQDNISVTLEELINDPVNGNYTNIIQSMQINPNATGEYAVYFGYSVAPNAHAVRMSVMAEDNYGVIAVSDQTYGIDYVAPIVWAVSPVGAPIDADAFPVAYESAVLPYGTPATIAVGFQDMQGFAVLETGEWIWVPTDGAWNHDYLVYYTGASGLNLAAVNVLLDGQPVNGTISGGAFTYNAGVLDAGIHTVVATVADNAGNVGSLAYTFTVTGGTPAISFTGVNGSNSYWLNSTENNVLGFSVHTQANVAIESAVANIYVEPGDYLIQGPITPAPNGNDYSVTLLGGVIPAGQYAIRMEVTATNVLGGSATSNQTYGIDNDAPAITLITPEENAVFAPGATVSILAQVSDVVATRGGDLMQARSEAKAGSGIDNTVLKLYAPSGAELINESYTAQVITKTHNLTANSELGNYTIVLVAADKAGNQSSITRSFLVSPVAGPNISFTDGIDWLNAGETNALTFEIDGEGITSVIANVYTNPAEALLMGPLAVQAVAGVYTVNVNGAMIPEDQNVVRLEVSASDVFGNVSVANNYYQVDKIAPMITLITPEANSVFVRGAVVSILAQVSDIVETKGGTLMQSRSDAKAGSGIDNTELKLYAPSGAELLNESFTTQVISKAHTLAADSEFGNYTIVLLATDKAGNQSVLSRNFLVAPISAPVVSFTDGIDWLNAYSVNELKFEVSGEGINTVIANVYANPSEALLMGPLSVVPAGGVYTVRVNGSMIPVDQSAIRLEINVTDIFGNESVANNYYNVDKIAPQITILAPAEGAEITRVDDTTAVRIKAEFTDVNPGSGIYSSSLLVLDPSGAQLGTTVVTGAGITETSLQIADLALGTYTARLTVLDNAGNQSVATVNFTVVDVPAPPAELDITEAHIFPNPMDPATGARFSINVNTGATVSVRVYDFAGREVRTMNYAAKSEGKAVVEVIFDGKNNDGVKLARGTYFARITANDGNKTVDKVVKIAIRK